jgi:hypothetical protein
MNRVEDTTASLSNAFDDALTLTQAQRSSALSNKITSILSTSFTDAEIREGLNTLDEKHVQNTAETRRRLRIDVQKELIDCNGDIVRDFGLVAEVCPASLSRHY